MPEYCRQEIEIGHQSGLSNVKYWLHQRGLPEDDDIVQAIFDKAKMGDTLLSEQEILAVVHQVRPTAHA